MTEVIVILLVYIHLLVDRGSQSSLLFRQTQGFVPAATRFLTVIVTMTLYVGTGNDGFADDIALILYQ